VFDHSWHARSPYRLPDLLWRAAVNRIRAEFEEMPSLRVTLSEARRLFGLPDPAASWVLRRLAREGFLVRTERGQYIRRAAHP
jgi:predicted transcriptional regulator of viral defense system